jgi:hypothetical protein
MKIRMLSSLACCRRLSALGVVTQDSEKTAFFLYAGGQRAGPHRSG